MQWIVVKLKSFIYFPLQFQPEEIIDVKSPFFSNQIETARQVALSLPGSYTLVVKDHPHSRQVRQPPSLTTLWLWHFVQIIRLLSS